MVEHSPIWSPDGRYIAYVTWTDTAGGNIYRVSADGNGQPERLTRATAYYDKIAYTRDGSRIMAVRGSRQQRMRNFEDFGSLGGGAELEYITIPAAGGDAARVTWIGAGASQEGRNVPHIGPDSTRMYVWAGTEGLVSMRFDGTDRKVVVRVTGPPPPAQPLPPGATPQPPPPPDEVLLSPDGRRALVACRQQRLPDQRSAGCRPGACGLGDGGLGRADDATHESRRRLHRMAERQSRGILFDWPQLLQLQPRAGGLTRSRFGRRAEVWPPRAGRAVVRPEQRRPLLVRPPPTPREEADDGVRGAALRRRDQGAERQAARHDGPSWCSHHHDERRSRSFPTATSSSPTIESSASARAAR